MSGFYENRARYMTRVHIDNSIRYHEKKIVWHKEQLMKLQDEVARREREICVCGCTGECHDRN